LSDLILQIIAGSEATKSVLVVPTYMSRTEISKETLYRFLLSLTKERRNGILKFPLESSETRGVVVYGVWIVFLQLLSLSIQVFSETYISIMEPYHFLSARGFLLKLPRQWEIFHAGHQPIL